MANKSTIYQSHCDISRTAPESFAVGVQCDLQRNDTASETGCNAIGIQCDSQTITADVLRSQAGKPISNFATIGVQCDAETWDAGTAGHGYAPMQYSSNQEKEASLFRHPGFPWVTEREGSRRDHHDQNWEDRSARNCGERYLRTRPSLVTRNYAVPSSSRILLHSGKKSFAGRRLPECQFRSARDKVISRHQQQHKIFESDSDESYVDSDVFYRQRQRKRAPTAVSHNGSSEASSSRVYNSSLLRHLQEEVDTMYPVSKYRRRPINNEHRADTAKLENLLKLYRQRNRSEKRCIDYQRVCENESSSTEDSDADARMIHVSSSHKRSSSHIRAHYINMQEQVSSSGKDSESSFHQQERTSASNKRVLTSVRSQNQTSACTACRHAKHIRSTTSSHEVNSGIQQNTQNSKKSGHLISHSQCSERKGYTWNECKKMIKYIVDNAAFSLVRGNTLWKTMSDSKVCNRSWQSMKEHFLKKVLPNIGKYGLQEQQLEHFRLFADQQPSLGHVDVDGDIVPGRRGWRRNGKFYTMEDDRKLLSFIVKSKRHKQTNGVKLWKIMEERKLLPGRSWQSMKERYRKVIFPNLKRYKLSPEHIHNLSHTQANHPGHYLGGTVESASSKRNLCPNNFTSHLKGLQNAVAKVKKTQKTSIVNNNATLSENSSKRTACGGVTVHKSSSKLGEGSCAEPFQNGGGHAAKNITTKRKSCPNNCICCLKHAKNAKAKLKEQKIDTVNNDEAVLDKVTDGECISRRVLSHDTSGEHPSRDDENSHESCREAEKGGIATNNITTKRKPCPNNCTCCLKDAKNAKAKLKEQKIDTVNNDEAVLDKGTDGECISRRVLSHDTSGEHPSRDDENSHESCREAEKGGIATNNITTKRKPCPNNCTCCLKDAKNAKAKLKEQKIDTVNNDEAVLDKGSDGECSSRMVLSHDTSGEHPSRDDENSHESCREAEEGSDATKNITSKGKLSPNKTSKRKPCPNNTSKGKLCPNNCTCCLKDAKNAKAILKEQKIDTVNNDEAVLDKGSDGECSSRMVLSYDTSGEHPSRDDENSHESCREAEEGSDATKNITSKGKLCSNNNSAKRKPCPNNCTCFLKDAKNTKAKLKEQKIDTVNNDVTVLDKGSNGECSSRMVLSHETSGEHLSRDDENSHESCREAEEGSDATKNITSKGKLCSNNNSAKRKPCPNNCTCFLKDAKNTKAKLKEQKIDTVNNDEAVLDKVSDGECSSRMVLSYDTSGEHPSRDDENSHESCREAEEGSDATKNINSKGKLSPNKTSKRKPCPNNTSKGKLCPNNCTCCLKDAKNAKAILKEQKIDTVNNDEAVLDKGSDGECSSRMVLSHETSGEHPSRDDENSHESCREAEKGGDATKMITSKGKLCPYITSKRKPCPSNTSKRKLCPNNCTCCLKNAKNAKEKLKKQKIATVSTGEAVLDKDNDGECISRRVLSHDTSSKQPSRDGENSLESCQEAEKGSDATKNITSKGKLCSNNNSSKRKPCPNNCTCCLKGAKNSKAKLKKQKIDTINNDEAVLDKGSDGECSSGMVLSHETSGENPSRDEENSNESLKGAVKDETANTSGACHRNCFCCSGDSCAAPPKRLKPKRKLYVLPRPGILLEYCSDLISILGGGVNTSNETVPKIAKKFTNRISEDEIVRITEDIGQSAAQATATCSHDCTCCTRDVNRHEVALKCKEQLTSSSSGKSVVKDNNCETISEISASGSNEACLRTVVQNAVEAQEGSDKGQCDTVETQLSVVNKNQSPQKSCCQTSSAGFPMSLQKVDGCNVANVDSECALDKLCEFKEKSSSGHHIPIRVEADATDSNAPAAPSQDGCAEMFVDSDNLHVNDKQEEGERAGGSLQGNAEGNHASLSSSHEVDENSVVPQGNSPNIDTEHLSSPICEGCACGNENRDLACPSHDSPVSSLVTDHVSNLTSMQSVHKDSLTFSLDDSQFPFIATMSSTPTVDNSQTSNANAVQAEIERCDDIGESHVIADLENCNVDDFSPKVGVLQTGTLKVGEKAASSTCNKLKPSSRKHDHFMLFKKDVVKQKGSEINGQNTKCYQRMFTADESLLFQKEDRSGITGKEGKVKEKEAIC